MSELPSAGTRNLIAGHPGRTADARRAALRLFVPEDGDASALTPFLLSVAADAAEMDLVRIEAIRVLPIAYVPKGEPAAAVRAALIQLAAEDPDDDVRNAAGSTLFDLPGAEEDVPRMREVIAGEPEELVRANIEAALRLFLDRKSRNGVEDLRR
jgi:HEAT repeat protein